MGIRPNKTNFGLSFGHFFGSKNVKKGGEKKKKRRRRRRKGKVWILVWNLYGNAMILYGSVCMEISGSISRV